MAENSSTPTLYDWLGGMPALEKLTQRFYEHVLADDILAPIFAGMPPEHPQQVAWFLAEVFGGPPIYSQKRGGHHTMIGRHLMRSLREEQRAQWVRLLCSTADEIGLPSDPEFRSAFVSYLEWGSRLAVINSQPGVKPSQSEPMPRWGWGVVGGPYRPPE